MADEKKGFWGRLVAGLNKTRDQKLMMNFMKNWKKC